MSCRDVGVTSCRQGRRAQQRPPWPRPGARAGQGRSPCSSPVARPLAAQPLPECQPAATAQSGTRAAVLHDPAAAEHGHIGRCACSETLPCVLPNSNARACFQWRASSCISGLQRGSGSDRLRTASAAAAAARRGFAFMTRSGHTQHAGSLVRMVHVCDVRGAQALAHMQDARLEALRGLPGKLQDPASSAELGAPGVLMSAWTKVLAILAAPNAGVRQAAAPVVGCIGAVASKQSSRAGEQFCCPVFTLCKRTMCRLSVAWSCDSRVHSADLMGCCLTGLHASAGVSPGLLFDWAIPLMSGYASGGVSASEGSVYWALSALQHGLRGCDSRAVTRYGNALLDACQALLEAEALPEHLLPLLLDVIKQVWCLHRARCSAPQRTTGLSCI